MANQDKPKEITKPFRVEDVPWEEWSEGAPRFGSRFRHLTSYGGGSRVGVQIEELAPGRQSCPLHYHMYEEEHVFVLEGSLTLRLGENFYEMKAGDFVCFPAGQRVGHCLINHSDSVCRFLVIGENNPNEVCVYPDSGKVMVRALREIYDHTKKLGYWDGEKAGD